MTRIAVVGVNHIGNIHCSVYSKIPGAELVGVCDLVEERATAAAQHYRTRAYTDLNALIEAERPDIISVATAGVEGGSQHFVPAMTAIDAGIDVLVEKPLSNQLHEARELVQRARESGVRLACNLNHRFAPAADKALQLVQSGALGTILFINMRLTIRNPNEQTPWIHMRALHTHSVDVMRFFGGDIRQVQAFMTKAPGRLVWSTASVNVQFASGAVGHLTGSYDMSMKHPIEFCEVAGDKGRLTIDNVYETLTFYPHESDESTVFRNPIFGGVGEFNDTFYNRLRRFVEEVEAQVPPAQVTGSGAEALAAFEVVEAAIESHLHGGTVVDVNSFQGLSADAMSTKVV